MLNRRHRDIIAVIATVVISGCGGGTVEEVVEASDRDWLQDVRIAPDPAYSLTQLQLQFGVNNRVLPETASVLWFRNGERVGERRAPWLERTLRGLLLRLQRRRLRRHASIPPARVP